jgi:hypothetical protein
MTEQDWQRCTAPQKMLEFLQGSGKLSERKARLFGVACSRRIWHLMVDERSRRSIDVAEQFADGAAGKESLAKARDDGQSAHSEALSAVRGGNACFNLSASWIAYRVARTKAARGAQDAIDFCPFAVSGVPRQAANQTHLAELRALADMLRDILGPLPFRPVALDPAWLTPSVVKLAQVAFDKRELPSGHLAAERLANLANSLEEAGCHDVEILGHLRGPRPHFRGCWVVDAVLAKS